MAVNILGFRVFSTERTLFPGRFCIISRTFFPQDFLVPKFRTSENFFFQRIFLAVTDLIIVVLSYDVRFLELV